MIIIDAHIHIHDCFNLGKFFDFAETNFKQQAKKINSNSFSGVLCLTEISGVDVFNKLRNIAGKKENIGSWNVGFTKEENSLALTKDNFTIFIIAGRQIVTEKKLEVLAIGLKKDFQDGKPAEEVIKHVVEFGAIPIIPWGFGKWFSPRKQILEKIVLQKKSYPIFLGDNGNRPWIFKKSKLIKLAFENNNILDLPGSDPLPFNREVKKPGSFGFYIEDVINQDKPFDNIYKIITTTKKQFKTYGKLESLFYFVKNQVAMQLVKRNRKN
jgi:hypothetical protein